MRGSDSGLRPRGHRVDLPIRESTPRRRDENDAHALWHCNAENVEWQRANWRLLRRTRPRYLRSDFVPQTVTNPRENLCSRLRFHVPVLVTDSPLAFQCIQLADLLRYTFWRDGTAPHSSRNIIFHSGRVVGVFLSQRIEIRRVYRLLRRALQHR